jgi:1-acyl-sn-glycerol-3-phosphate acyltransferase
MAGFRRLFRLPALAGLLLVGLSTVFVVFPFAAQPRRDALVRRWSQWLVATCGVRIRESVAPGARSLADQPGGRMLFLNHISWLDIFVIDALAPTIFVAKSEIARWPLAGTLVARVGTVFVERGRRGAVHRVVKTLTGSLASGRRVAVFPEGTTSDGSRVLPFFGNLAEAAIHAGVPIVPVALRYVDAGGVRTRIPAFIGDDGFLGSVWRITGGQGLVAELHVLPPIDTATGRTRQAIAREARRAISERLGLPLDDTVPEIFRDR